MRLAAATAGLMSTAALLSGCNDAPQPKREKADPVRRTIFGSHLARRAALMSCGETAAQRALDQRFGQLRQFAGEKGLEQSLWLGQNDFNAYAAYADEGPGDCAVNLQAYSSKLDLLAAAVAEHRE